MRLRAIVVNEAAASPVVASTAMPSNSPVRTIAEIADERTVFISWIAATPSAGDVIPGSGGCPKVRSSASRRGKRGGARVVCFLQAEHRIWLLIACTKAKFDNLPPEFLAELKCGVEDAL
jgi:hypothetical protein